MLKLALFDAELKKLQERYNYKIVKVCKVENWAYIIIEEGD